MIVCIKEIYKSFAAKFDFVGSQKNVCRQTLHDRNKTLSTTKYLLKAIKNKRNAYKREKLMETISDINNYIKKKICVRVCG